jgi:hypothetical protein
MSQPNTDEMFVPSIVEEFRGVDLGDRRREVRLIKTVERMAPAPALSIPRATGNKNDMHAAYRLLSNPAVTAKAVLQPHIQQTVDRISRAPLVVVAHDTSECEYSGAKKRKGLGPLRSASTQGFLAHVSLAIGADEASTPLGALAVHTWARKALGRGKKNGRNRSGGEYATMPDRESARWASQVKQVAALLKGKACIHVMDREADAFELLDTLIADGHRFVVRASQARVARTDEHAANHKVHSLARSAEGVFETQVPISARAASTIPANSKTFGPRESRRAKLAFSAGPVQLRRPKYLQGDPWLSLHFVRVFELDPPEGAEPIEWLLYTTEPIDTVEQVIAIVGYYRKRWLIEELFKALKTGCALEERQLESYQALGNALAIAIPIAWQMLVLRSVARSAPDAPAETVLSPIQLDVLRACARTPFPPRATARQALIAVAILGGYVPNKREPGWLVLGRGMERLLGWEVGWAARTNAPQTYAES